MFSLSGFKGSCIPRWWIILPSILLIYFFLRLGFWQLHRAEEKKIMLAQYQHFSRLSPEAWDIAKATPKQYEKIYLDGTFLPRVFLLDNQFFNHQFGYHVISPLLLSNNQIILVDRGWVRGDISRQMLPQISNPKGVVRITGSVYYPSSKSILLGQLLEKKKKNVQVIEIIDTQLLSQSLHKSVYPFMIRLDKQETNGFVREWRIVSMPPQRHYAYALQWFSLAGLALILFIVICYRKYE